MTRRVPPTDVCSYMEQITVKPQIANLGILSAAPKTSPNEGQLQHYLDNPPAGKLKEIYIFP